MRKRRGLILILGIAAAGLVFLFAAQQGPGFRSIQTTETREIALEVTGGSGGSMRIEREFRPKVVYPYHYRNQDSTFEKKRG